MKTSELRLRNIVELLTDPNPIAMPSGVFVQMIGIGFFESQICGIDKPIIQQEPKSISNIKLSPIPLTEEWLLKFGSNCDNFTHRDKTISKDVYLFNSLAIQYVDGTWILCKLASSPINYDLIYLREVQYVHQLQNLYFILTGQELEINNKQVPTDYL